VGFQPYQSALVLASLVTVGSFVGATAYTQNRLARLDALSSTIETNAAPSSEYLSRAAVSLTRLHQLLDEAASAGSRRDAAVTAVRNELSALQDDVRRYLDLPMLPGEGALWATLRTDVNRARDLVAASLARDEEGRDTSSGAHHRGGTDAALDAAVRSVLATLDFDVHQSESMAREVRTVRRGTLRTIVALDSGATAVALFGVFIAFRASRRHDELLQQHASLLAARVNELDLFAGRVAHDVLSPLGTIATALSLLERSCDERSRTYIDRSQRVVQRTTQLVTGLLEFARSGANPDLASTSSLDAAIRNIVADCADTASENGIELIATVAEGLQVRCSLGVATSIVQNLIRNAIKYMGTSRIRRIEVRAMRVHAMAHLEVEDTGPGIPPELQPRLFDPFMRGIHADVAGVGLGLATVKRLVESHRGAIGVRSYVGAGTTFWVELPLVDAAAAAGRESSSE